MTLPADVVRVSVFGENMYLYQCVNLAAVSGVLWPGSVYTRVPSVNIANGEQIYWQLGNDTAAKLHSVHLYCLLWSWRQQSRIILGSTSGVGGEGGALLVVAAEEVSSVRTS